MMHLVESIGFVGERPWHGIGVELPPNITAMEAMRKSGLDWSVSTEPIHTGGIEIPGYKAVVRDNGSVLGVVSNSYRPLQNAQGFQVFESVIQTGLARIETAGSLKGGRIVWALARVQSEDLAVTSEDLVRPFVLLSFGHDGQRSIRIGFVPTRIVCWNTMQAATLSENARLVRVSHRGDVVQNTQALIDAMDLSVQEFRVTVGEYRKMLNTSINQKDLREYVRVTLGVVESTENKRATNLVDRVVSLASIGKGNAAVAGTVWAAYNGVTEYLTHQASRNVDNRFHSLWFGNNKQVLQRAYDEAVRLVA